MAIRKLSEENGKAVYEIDNGHLTALKKVTEDYKIEDEEKTLGFILAVASKSEGKPLKVGEDSFVPGEAIKKKDGQAPTVPPVK